MVDSLLKSQLTESAITTLEKDGEFQDLEYWANGDASDVADHVLDKMRKRDDALDSSSIFTKIWRSHDYYYGFTDGEGDYGDTAVQVTGEHGQILTFSINMYRYVIRQLLTMVTSDPPVYDVVPANIDTSSQVQARLGEDVLNHYLTKKGWMRVLRETMEDALVMGLGFCEVVWDAAAGDVLSETDAESGMPVDFYEGDVKVVRRDFFDVIWDIDGVEDDEEVRWICVRVRENRYDLAARYGDMADEILGMSLNGSNPENEETSRAEGSGQENDDIWTYRFYARPSDALPDGRMVIFLEDYPDDPLIDMDLPYRRIPVLWTRVAKARRTLLGWSPAFDIQKQQELITATLEKIATIQDSLGLPIVWAGGRGVDVPDPETWVGNVAFIQSEKKPEQINLGKIPEEMFKTLEVCVQSMEKVLGLNDSVQGQSAGSLRANRMQVFQAEQSLRYNSDAEAAFFELFERTGTMALEILRDFPENERVLTAVGKQNRDALISFTGDNLYSIVGVTVRPGSRLTRTTEGRLEILNLLSQNGVALPKEELLAIVNGAPIDAVTHGAEGQLDIANSENESLLRGGFHKALFTDNHLYHMRKHAAVLNSPIARGQSDIVRGVARALMEHAALYNNPQIFELQVALGYASVPPSGGGAMGGGGGAPPKQIAGPSAPPGGVPEPEGALPGRISGNE